MKLKISLRYLSNFKFFIMIKKEKFAVEVPSQVGYTSATLQTNRH